MASMVQRQNTPSTQMARQYWSQHNWDNMERLRMLDPYAEPRNVPGERLEASIPIQGTAIIAKPSPVKMLSLCRIGSLHQVAAELHAYTTAGGDVNERMSEEYMCPGVRELDTFLHVALRHRQVDVSKYLMVQGADAAVQNWHLETPRMVAAQVGLEDVIAEMGQEGDNTKWGGATVSNFQPPIQIAPQRSVVEAHYAWREGAPKTTAPTKAVFTYHPGSTALSTRKPVPGPMPSQRENGPSSAVSGRPSRRPHHHSSSSPMGHYTGTRDTTTSHLTGVGFRQLGAAGAAPAPSVAGSRYAGARLTSSAPVY